MLSQARHFFTELRGQQLIRFVENKDGASMRLEGSIAGELSQTSRCAYD
jgi:hypothetical protein